MELLERILSSEKNERQELIFEFQKIYLNENLYSIDEREFEILSELAFDLDFYEPDMNVRKQDPSYYGDDQLEMEVLEAIEKIKSLTKL